MKRRERYQVFCSSVSNELVELRTKIIESILMRNRYFPIAMEYFTAHTHTITMLYEYISQSDIYLLVLKNSLGSPIGEQAAEILMELCEKNPKIKSALDVFLNRTGLTIQEITFTQLEYVFALVIKLPILIFVYQDDHENSFEERVERFNGENFTHAVMKWKDEHTLIEMIQSSLDNTVQRELSPMAGWIRKVDNPLFKATAKVGINSIRSDGGGFISELKNKLVGAKTLYLLFTTGRGFIVNNQNMLADFLSQGGNIRLITALPHSEFLKEVAYAESSRFGDRSDIHEEYEQVFKTLTHIYAKSKHSHGNNIGTIEMANFGTLFRSSVVVCEYENCEWGWLTITLPPEKSADMISLELEYPCPNYPNNRDNLLHVCKDHILSLWKLAETRSEIVRITDESKLEKKKPISKMDNALGNRAYWEERYKEGRKNQRSNRRNKKVLIEVAAQHPLVEGEFPGKEFEARLCEATRICDRLQSEGCSVEIFVPGSLHLDPDGVEEVCSLSDAGVTWLKEAGLSESILHGEDLIEKYQSERNWPGVYNTGDECDIASRYYFEEHFGALICVCSPNQLMRKTLFYMDHGILAQIVTVPVANMFHNFLGEIYEAVPYVLKQDSNLQGLDSKEAVRTRKERLSGFDD